MTAEEIVSQMTLEEKTSLCSGKDLWMLKSVERLGLSSIMVADGPHGLRKQIIKHDNLGAFESVPATCFPTAAATACSFDRDLLYSIGQAIGEECLQEKVAVVLGPGINIKRSPLCGRNFEYISEDPYTSGEIAAALINGAQSKGVGASLKHYAVNNQEKARFICNSVVDERALREIYLAGFEIAVKKSQPWTIMGSYNPVNGVYACENHKLLTEILRDEWGFKGLVVTAWGACNDRVQGVKAGLDLEMPGSGGINDKKITEAVNNGSLDMKDLDRAALRLVELILKAHKHEQKNFQFDKQAHHSLARKAAAESAVLLKNDNNALPLKQGQSIALIGSFAKTPRYQGAGSSRINPLQLDNVHDALSAAGVTFEYAQGYSGVDPDPALIEEAVKIAKGKDKVIIIAGLPDEYESEGFDRASLDMPLGHNQLIEAAVKVNPNVIVVLQLGSPAALPWADKVKVILAAYLGGQAGGSAIANLLLGKVTPSGKLTETWPLSLQDIPCSRYFGGSRSVEYRESIFVGYRYYDHGDKQTAYPFGYGLSYTSFEYSDLSVSSSSFNKGDTLKVNFTIKNTGNFPGAEAAQIYIAPKKTSIMRAVKELKGFEKIFLQKGESKKVTITLDERSFAYYNAPKKNWAIEGGIYEILIGASSRDIRLKSEVNVSGDGFETLLADQKNKSPEYFNLAAKELVISDGSFEALYGQKLPPKERQTGSYDVNCTLTEIAHTEPGKKLAAKITEHMAVMFGGSRDGFRLMMESMMMDLPLRSLAMVSGGLFNLNMAEAFVDILNGKPCANPELEKMFKSGCD